MNILIMGIVLKTTKLEAKERHIPGKTCPVSAMRRHNEAGYDIINRFKCNNMKESSVSYSEC